MTRSEVELPWIFFCLLLLFLFAHVKAQTDCVCYNTYESCVAAAANDYSDYPSNACDCIQNLVSCNFGSCSSVEQSVAVTSCNLLNEVALCPNLNCNSISSATPPPTVSPTSALTYQQVCANSRPAGNCNYYTNCLNVYVDCGPNGYALSYGAYYCNRYFGPLSTSLSVQAQIWRGQVMFCLQTALDNWISSLETAPTCDEITTFAFNSHPQCYTNPGGIATGFCYLPSDWLTILEITGRGLVLGTSQWAAWKQVASVMTSCAGEYGNAVMELELNVEQEIADTAQALINLGNQVASLLSIPRYLIEFIESQPQPQLRRRSTEGSSTGSQLVLLVITTNSTVGNSSTISQAIAGAANNGTLSSLSISSGSVCNATCQSSNYLTNPSTTTSTSSSWSPHGAGAFWYLIHWIHGLWVVAFFLWR